MIFHHLIATFGNLNGQRLTLSDGLNVIEAPNESGKSTWCTFLQAMLYGINTRERDSKTALAEKNRYQPWSGAAMEGELTLTVGGKELIIRRSSKSSAFDTCTVTDAAGEPIPGLSGSSVGQALLGVGREVYERSAFVRQGGGTPLGGSAELERRIAALVSSGDEAVSYTEADSTLREWLRRRRHNKTGLIPKLEAELAQIDEQLARLDGYSQRIAAAKQQEKELTEQLASIRQDLSIHARLNQQEQNVRYAHYQADWQAAAEKADQLQKELQSLGPLPAQEAMQQALAALSQLDALNQQEQRADGEARQAAQKAQQARADAGMFCFLGMTPDEAWQQAEEDADEVELRQQAASKSGRNALIGLLFSLIAGGVLSAVLLFLRLLPFPWCVGSGCALFAAAGLLSLFVSRHRRNAHQEEADALLEPYGADTSGEIRAYAADYRARCARADEAEAAAAAAEEAARTLRLACAAKQNEILSFVQTFAPAATTPATAERAIQQILSLLHAVQEAEERRNSARHLFNLVAEQGGSNVLTTESLTRPARSEEELSALQASMERALAQVREALSAAEGAQAALGDPAALYANREQVAEQLARRQAEYEALSLAQRALEEANRAFRARISPELNRRATALFSALTGGAYDHVLLDRTFEAQARPAGTLQPRSTLSLSEGAADQLYLAVRLALCSLLLPQQDPIPLVLDDVLCNFDDHRMALALQVLLQLSQSQQVLLFTCHSREREWLRSKGAPCNFLQMGI